MKFSVLIADNDEATISIVEKGLHKVKPGAIIEVCKTGERALKAIQDRSFDMAFVDLHLPGFDLSKMKDSMSNITTLVILSADSRMARDAFDVGATDFLLKPVTLSRFMNTIVKKATRDIGNVQQSLMQHHKSFFVRHKNGIVKVFENDIFLVEGQADYVNIYTSNEVHTVHSTMKNMEKQLTGKLFIRIHKSYLVRIDAIEAVEGNKVKVHGKTLPLSRNYKKSLMSKLKIL